VLVLLDSVPKLMCFSPMTGELLGDLFLSKEAIGTTAPVDWKEIYTPSPDIICMISKSKILRRFIQDY